MSLNPIRIELPEILNMQSVNSWLIKDPVPTLIDCGELTEGSWKALNKQLGENGLQVSDIEKIIITHAHVDHMGMANRVVEHSNAKVWMSEYCYEWGANVNTLWETRSALMRNTFAQLVSKESPMSNFFVNGKSFFNSMLKMWEPIPEENTIRFESKDGIDIGGQHWQSIYTPGHSATQTVFFQPESRQMFSADMLLKLTPTPVIELDPVDPSKRQKGLPMLIDSFHAMRELNISVAYPGHYETLENLDQLIETQLRRIDMRLEETKSLIQSGKNRYSDLITAMYADRISFPAIVMLIGYLDVLEERGLITKSMGEEGIYLFRTI